MALTFLTIYERAGCGRHDADKSWSMKEWSLPLLRCLECDATAALEVRPADVRCRRCGTTYAKKKGVVDFLYQPHPTVLRERAAVHRIDSETGPPPDSMAGVLDRLNRDQLTGQDLEYSAHIRAIAESRAQVLDLLGNEHLAPGSTVLEIGADVGWSSAILLDAGCRVLATDITDHLLNAPDPNSVNLCRLLADMNRVPLADSTVDAVFAASCVHHSWNLGLTFREIARVLKPGGTAYLCGEPLPSLPRYVVGGRFGRKERALGINETWTRRAVWLRRCREAGLEPRIVFPDLSDRQMSARLRKRGLPAFLGPMLRPALSLLQVSVHLLAHKPAPGAGVDSSFPHAELRSA